MVSNQAFQIAFSFCLNQSPIVFEWTMCVSSHYGSYYASGLFGQLISIYPYENIIIVRVGESDLNYNPQFIRQNVVQIIDQIPLNN